MEIDPPLLLPPVIDVEAMRKLNRARVRLDMVTAICATLGARFPADPPEETAKRALRLTDALMAALADADVG